MNTWYLVNIVHNDFHSSHGIFELFEGLGANGLEESPKPQEQYLTNGHANGHANAHMNGHINGSAERNVEADHIAPNAQQLNQQINA